MGIAITLVSFLFFTALVAFLTWKLAKVEDVETSSGYFLAGRSLTFPFIAVFAIYITFANFPVLTP